MKFQLNIGIDFVDADSVADQGRYIHPRKEVRLALHLPFLIQRRASHLDAAQQEAAQDPPDHPLDQDRQRDGVVRAGISHE